MPIKNFCFTALTCLVVATACPSWAQQNNLFDRFQPVASALEAYALDNNGKYPPNLETSGTRYWQYLPSVLTTPIAYLQSHQMNDPYSVTSASEYRLSYINVAETFQNNPDFSKYRNAYGEWLVYSVGPSRSYTPQYNFSLITLYDSTNGTFSRGIMLRNQRMLKETGVN